MLPHGKTVRGVRRGTFLCLLGVAVWGAALGGDPDEPGILDLDSSVSDVALRAGLQFLAAPALEGRESGTRGYDIAALYVAARLEELGLRPGAPDRSFFQHLDLVRRGWNSADARLSFRGADGCRVELPLENEIRPLAAQSVDWSGRWLLLGRGEGASADSRDEYHGWTLKDTVVLLVPGKRAGRIAAAEARRRGARRIVVVSDLEARRPSRSRGDRLASDVAEFDRFWSTSEFPETVFISESVADRLLAAEGLSVRSFRGRGPAPGPRLLQARAVRLRIPRDDRRRPTCNVVGLIQGTDPTLRGEYVVLGAHLDHLGVRGGKVFPGADDDASGVVALLEIARTLRERAVSPRRSLLFVFFTAEEKGLFGSRHFVEHSPIPLDRIVLEIQLDMVGRRPSDGGDSSDDASNREAGPRVFSVGTRRHSGELDPWIQRLARDVGIRVEPGREGFYYRSDHYVFGRRGIPVAFLFTGIHEDYHKPTDTADRIDYPTLTAVTRLALRLCLQVASRDRPPLRDRV
jgi:hypothetical protein